MSQSNETTNLMLYSASLILEFPSLSVVHAINAEFLHGVLDFHSSLSFP